MCVTVQALTHLCSILQSIDHWEYNSKNHWSLSVKLYKLLIIESAIVQNINHWVCSCTKHWSFSVKLYKLLIIEWNCINYYSLSVQLYKPLIIKCTTVQTIDHWNCNCTNYWSLSVQYTNPHNDRKFWIEKRGLGYRQ